MTASCQFWTEVGRCVTCHRESLRQADSCLVCTNCNREYEISGGVPLFVREKDSGYFEYLNSTQEVFDPSRADQLYRETKSEFQNAIRLLDGTEDGDHVVDIGAGYGGFARLLEEEGFNSTSIDVNVGRMQKISQWGHRAAVSFASDLPFADSSVDVVCFIASLPHLPSPSEAFEEAYRILRPGGVLLVDSYNIVNALWRLFFVLGKWEAIAGRQGWHYFQSTLSMDHLKSLAEETGFEFRKNASYTPLSRGNSYIRLPWSSLSCLRLAVEFEAI